MSDSPRPSKPEAAQVSLQAVDLGSAGDATAFAQVADAATAHDGLEPFNEQSRFDSSAGRRTAYLVRSHAVTADESEEVVAAAILGHGELDLTVLPARRSMGLGTAAARELLAIADHGELTAWSHGDHPAARALAAANGFRRTRALLKLRLADVGTADLTTREPADVRIRSFDDAHDAEDWVALNARIFAAHPEQGGVTLRDLRDREGEDWFDSADFLIAERDGRMIGYDWLKIEPGSDEGEIYVLGVDAAAAGRGLGRALLVAGLRRLVERGCRTVVLYVEEDNTAAVPLYRSSGFVDDVVDVQYTRD